MKRIFITILFLSPTITLAWSIPPLGYTNGNTTGPIDRSISTQQKAGALGVASFIANSITVSPSLPVSNSVVAQKFCIGTTCITSWPASSDNLGNHIATKALVMSNFNITNIGKATGVPTVDGDSANTLTTKGYVDSKIPACFSTPRSYKCPVYDETGMCISSFPCEGQIQGETYCNRLIPSVSMGCVGCGCYTTQQISCEPQW